MGDIPHAELAGERLEDLACDAGLLRLDDLQCFRRTSCCRAPCAPNYYSVREYTDQRSASNAAAGLHVASVALSSSRSGSPVVLATYRFFARSARLCYPAGRRRVTRRRSWSERREYHASSIPSSGLRTPDGPRFRTCV